jgi:hypothetical protein
MTTSSWVLFAVFVADLLVFYRLWASNRWSSLSHTVTWALVSWLAWILTLPLEPPGTRAGPWTYLALALTGCASVAVLGARRPGVAMWNAVVVALLAVELLPWAESVVRQDDLHFDALRMASLAGAIVIGVVNYLPTHYFLSALLVGIGCACAWVRFWKADDGTFQAVDFLGRSALGTAPVAGWLFGNLLQHSKANEFDRCWIGFRDRFGVVWGQRLREQFNQAARHAGHHVRLTWQGLRRLQTGQPIDRKELSALLQILQALMKRFGGSNEQ